MEVGRVRLWIGVGGRGVVVRVGDEVRGRLRLVGYEGIRILFCGDF